MYYKSPHGAQVARVDIVSLDFDRSYFQSRRAVLEGLHQFRQEKTSGLPTTDRVVEPRYDGLHAFRKELTIFLRKQLGQTIVADRVKRSLFGRFGRMVRPVELGRAREDNPWFSLKR